MGHASYRLSRRSAGERAARSSLIRYVSRVSARPVARSFAKTRDRRDHLRRGQPPPGNLYSPSSSSALFIRRQSSAKLGISPLSLLVSPLLPVFSPGDPALEHPSTRRAHLVRRLRRVISVIFFPTLSESSLVVFLLVYFTRTSSNQKPKNSILSPDRI